MVFKPVIEGEVLQLNFCVIAFGCPGFLRDDSSKGLAMR